MYIDLDFDTFIHLYTSAAIFYLKQTVWRTDKSVDIVVLFAAKKNGDAFVVNRVECDVAKLGTLNLLADNEQQNESTAITMTLNVI